MCFLSILPCFCFRQVSWELAHRTTKENAIESPGLQCLIFSGTEAFPGKSAVSLHTLLWQFGQTRWHGRRLRKPRDSLLVNFCEVGFRASSGGDLWVLVMFVCVFEVSIFRWRCWIEYFRVISYLHSSSCCLDGSQWDDGVKSCKTCVSQHSAG